MRRLLQAGVGVCLVAFLCGAWTPPMFLQVAPTNYKAYWSFEDATNPANANDPLFNGNRINNGAAATATNGPLRDTTLVPPPFAGIVSTASMKFDGNDAITVGTPPLDLVKGKQAVTLAGWVRTTSLTGTKDIIRIATNDAANTRALLSLVEGKLRGGGRAADAETQLNRTASNALPLNTWTHVAAVINYNGDSVILYVNGQAAAMDAGTTAFTASPTSATDSAGAGLGSNVAGTGNRWAGNLDDLRIYERVLNATEIRSLAAPKVPIQNDAVAGPESIIVSWDGTPQPGPAGTLGYNVYRRLAGTTVAYEKVNTTPVTGTSYTDHPPIPQGTAYQYIVRSVQIELPRIESIDSNAKTMTPNPPNPRVGGDNEEGLFEDKCACGSSIPAPALPTALAGLAALVLALRRRRSL